MKKKIITIMTIFVTIIIMASCAEVTTYQFIDEGFNQTIKYDKENEEISLAGLYITSDEEAKTPVTWDMVKEWDGTDSVGLKELTLTYQDVEQTFNYSVYYEVAFMVEGSLYDTDYIINIEEFAYPEVDPSVSGFIGWEEKPTSINDNIVINALIKNTVTPDTPSISSLSATYGDTYNDISLPANSFGKWTFKEDLNTSVGNVGSKEVDLVFIPSDPSKYDEVEKRVTLNVSKKEVTITPQKTYTYTGSKIDLKYSFDVKEELNVIIEGDYDKIDVGTYNAIIKIDDANYSGEVAFEYEIKKANIIISTKDVSVAFDKVDTLEVPAYEITGDDVDDNILTSLNVKVSIPQITTTGEYKFNISYDENPNLDVSLKPGTITVTKGTYVVDSPDIKDDITIMYGDTIDETDLKEVANGKWVLANGTYYVDKVGEITLDVIFIPDNDNYQEVTSTVKVTSQKRVLEFKNVKNVFTYNPNGSKVTFTLSNLVKEEDLESIAIDGNDLRYDVGSYDVNLTINDDRYEGSIITILVIEKADPAFDIPQITAVYGDILKDIKLPEGFEWNTPSQKLSEIGIVDYLASYTPNDTHNYNIIKDISITINVLKAETIINSADDFLFVVGDDYDLNASLSHKESTINYDCSDLQVGLNKVVLSVPESEHYKAASKEVNVYLIDKLTKVEVTYDENLYLETLPLPTYDFGKFTFSKNQKLEFGLNQSAIVTFAVNVTSLSKELTLNFDVKKKQLTFEITKDTFVYNGQAQKVEYSLPYEVEVIENNTSLTNVGSIEYSLVIDDKNYEGSFNGTLTITKASLTITLLNQTIIYGEELDQSKYEVSNGTNYNEEVKVEIYSEETLNVGTHKLNAHITNDSNYEVEVIEAEVTVNNANLEEAPTPELRPITFEDTITNDYIISENFTLTNDQVVLSKENVKYNNNQLEVTISLTYKIDNYNPYIKEYTFVVNKKVLEIKIVKNEFTYDETAHSLEVEIAGDSSLYELNGNTKYTSANEDGYDITLSITSNYYEALEVKGKLIINKGNLSNIDFPSDLEGYYDDTLQTIELGDHELGSFSFEDSLETKLTNVGPMKFMVIFTPSNENYNVIKEEVTINVLKRIDASLNIKKENLTLYNNDPNLLNNIKNNVEILKGDENQELEFAYYLNEELVPSLEQNGTYRVEVKALESTHFKESRVYEFAVVLIDGSIDKLEFKGYYGDKLSSVVLPEGWQWDNKDLPLGKPDEQHRYKVNYVVNDEILDSKEIMVKVQKRIVEITVSPETVVYDSLEHSLGNYSVNVLPADLDNELIYEVNIAGDAINQRNVGTYTNTYTLVSEYYEAKDVSASLTITKAPLTITLLNQTIIYGEKLDQSKYEVSNGTNYNEEVKVEIYSDATLNVGTHKLNAHITNDSNYEVEVIEAEVTVNNADLEEAPTPELRPITFEDTITNDYIISENFTLTNGQVVLSKENVKYNNNQLEVTISLTYKIDNYNPYIKEYTFVVNKKVLEIKIVKNEFTYDETAHSLEVKIAGDSSLYELNGNTGHTSANEDGYDITLSITSNYYEALEVKGKLIINKAIPDYKSLITQNFEATINDKLSTVILPKGFAWLNGEQVITSASVTEYEAIYTPEDTNNYQIVECKITIKVNRLINEISSTLDEYIFMYDGSTLYENSLNELLIKTNLITSINKNATYKFSINDSQAQISQADSYQIKIEAKEDDVYQSTSKMITFILIENVGTISATYGDLLASKVPKSAYGTWKFNDERVTKLSETLVATFISNLGTTKEFNLKANIVKKKLSINILKDAYIYDGLAHEIKFDISGVVEAVDNVSDIKKLIKGNFSITNVNETEAYDLTLDDTRYELDKVYSGVLTINKADVEIRIEGSYADNEVNKTVNIDQTMTFDTIIQDWYQSGYSLSLSFSFFFKDSNQAVNINTLVNNEDHIGVYNVSANTYGTYSYKIEINDDNFNSFTYEGSVYIYIARVTTATTDITSLDAPFEEGRTSLEQALKDTVGASSGTYIYLYGDTILGLDGETNEYKLGAGVELFMPHSSSQTSRINYNPETGDSTPGSLDAANPKIEDTITKNLQLTILEDVTLYVYGALTIGADRGQNKDTSGSGNLVGDTRSGYSEIKLEGNIIVHGSIRCYGYIRGNGSIDTVSGANIYEPLVITDWPGATKGGGVYGGARSKRTINNRVPFSQFEVHHIEVKTKISYGANLIALAAIFTSKSTEIITIDARWNTADYPIFGSNALIGPMDEKSYIIKIYDTVNKKLNIQLYGNIEDNSASLKVKIVDGILELDMKTEGLYFPISYKINIEAMPGSNVNLNQKYKLLPGAVFVIDDRATVNLAGDVIIYKDYVDRNTGITLYPTGKGEPEFVVRGTLNVTGGIAGVIHGDTTGKLNLASAKRLELTSNEGIYTGGTKDLLFAVEMTVKSSQHLFAYNTDAKEITVNWDSIIVGNSPDALNDYKLMNANYIWNGSKWVAGNRLISFDTGGIEEVDIIGATANQTITEADLPYANGHIVKIGDVSYQFEGWYKDQSHQERVTSFVMPDENITLYANWIQYEGNIYKFTYTDMTGTKVEYYKEGETITLPNYNIQGQVYGDNNVQHNYYIINGKYYLLNGYNDSNYTYGQSIQATNDLTLELQYDEIELVFVTITKLHIKKTGFIVYTYELEVEDMDTITAIKGATLDLTTIWSSVTCGTSYSHTGGGFEKPIDITIKYATDNKLKVTGATNIYYEG